MLQRLFSPKNLKGTAFEIIGSFLTAVALYNFALNAKFLMTGFSGVALILYRLFNLPIGAVMILLNIPVAIWCYKLLGRGFFLRSVRCTILSSLMVDYVAPLLPIYTGDRLLAALCTGVLSGIGYALIYMHNSSTGGSDFIIMAIRAKRPHLSLGRISFAIELVIILAGGLIFRDMNGVLYGLLVNYISAQMVDKMLYGVDAGKLTLIITE
ncbi:MAG: YitT family protein, partial [Clostridia bacterium]|nr:YitT family protein [Clostridia bacterium]